MLSAENRVQIDDRTLCELFYDVCDELPDITWHEAFRILMELLVTTATKKLFLAEDELESLLDDFMSGLPKTFRSKMRNCA